MTSAPVLLSVNVGLPRDVPWQGKTVHTGIAIGVGLERVHTELFGALPSVNPGLTGQHRRPLHPPPGPPGPGPLVTFARSGISAAFGGGWRSVLELADSCDVPTPVELPDRRLPHLRDTAAVRPGGLPPGPAGTARRRRGADLLRAARLRPRPGHVRHPP